MSPGAATRVFALLGDPVSHSLSPAIHNAAFRALGIDAVYVALRCGASDVVGLMRGLAAAGGGGNVTVPHKRIAASAATGASGESYRAANTFWQHHGGLAVADTDGAGIVAGWKALGSPAGSWLLIGTGGSAVAAARAGLSLGVLVTVRSRSAERQRRFESFLADLGQRNAVPGPIGLVINCTPVGLHDASLPLPLEAVPAGAAALDLVYRVGETAWVRALRRRGQAAADGREVLLGQGVAALRCWFPGIDPPTEVMRAAARDVLGPPAG